MIPTRTSAWSWAFTFKAGYTAFVLLMVNLIPSMNVSAYHRVMVHWPRDAEPLFGSYFATWDGAHYLFLSEVGYVKGSSSCAFYPLLPFLTSTISYVTAGNHLVAGLLLCNAASLVGVVLFHKLVAERFDPRTASLSLVLLLTYPGALFFQFIYTESLFFLFLMILCWGLERKYYAAVFCGGFFLSLLRPVGVFALVPLAWILWTQRVPRKHWFAFTGPAVGWLVYFVLMWLLVGNPFEGFSAQAQWGTNSIRNIVDIPKFIVGFFNPTGWHAYRGSVLDRACFMFLISTLPAIWRLDRTWFFWSIMLGVLPAMIATFTSFTRYLVIVFPFFVALACHLQGENRRWLRRAVITAFAGLHVCLLIRHINFYWAG